MYNIYLYDKNRFSYLSHFFFLSVQKRLLIPKKHPLFVCLNDLNILKLHCATLLVYS